MFQINRRFYSFCPAIQSIPNLHISHDAPEVLILSAMMKKEEKRVTGVQDSQPVCTCVGQEQTREQDSLRPAGLFSYSVSIFLGLSEAPLLSVLLQFMVCTEEANYLLCCKL